MSTSKTLAIFAASLILSGSLHAQHRFEFEPSKVTVSVGDSVQVTARLVDAEGNQVAEQFMLLARGGGVEIRERMSSEGGVATTHVIGRQPGSFTLTTRTLGGRDERISGQLEIAIPFPPLAALTVDVPRRTLYPGSTMRLRTSVTDAAGLERDEVPVLTSSDPTVIDVDRFGTVTAIGVGRASVSAAVGGVSGDVALEVVANPIARIDLRASGEEVRTGDVVHFTATAVTASGTTVPDAMFEFTVSASPDDSYGQPASALVDDEGRFVAEVPGLYTVNATSGAIASRKTIRVEQRSVAKRVELLGHAPVLDVHTSDLWIWEGVDGRDYAITGTWSANGEAYFWDVTDPAHMEKIDVVKVDARTVNDVKVSEDGRTCVISREGASNRKNGIVILDCTNPRDVKIVSTYDDELTGGVHNVFIYDGHVYAVNNGRRYDVINIEDPANPHRVGRFELDTPGHSIHDVWIEDGIAYSSNWKDGLQLVDVGGAAKAFPATPDARELPNVQAGAFGGSPANPVQFASYTYPSGWNHAAFPYRSETTDKFYVIGGDEAFTYDEIVPDAPEKADGWLHFVDFTNLAEPTEVARYKVPEAGSHNYWVEGDVLYAGFYNGGLRVVDLSGELMGDLYRQGREIAQFLPSHPDAVVRNAPMVWGVQPHKGTIFIADHYSGLWAIRLVAEESQ